MNGILNTRTLTRRKGASAIGVAIALTSALTSAAIPGTGSASTWIIPDTSPVKNAPAQKTKKAEFPALKAAGQKHAKGAAAIQRLGKDLPKVANWYGMSARKLERMLRNDPTAKIDQKGRLLFVEELLDYTSPEQGLPEAAAPFPLGDTFTLHSRPGAKRVIYLDFDGHETTGTVWNTNSGIDPIISPPYTRDSDPAFSTLELEYIQKMWRQVSEDYAPFDIDITTEDPGSAAIIRSSNADEYYGTRMIITQDNFENCGCGGFAYVGVFDYIGATYKPAFVFNTSLVGAGEAITHEAGHNLGLSHDGNASVGYYQGHGSGATGWAPIMGVGYYQSLVQWSKGEYTGANNSQDDIVVIQNNGAPLMADDHGNTDATATGLSVSSNGTTATLSGTGLIESSGDVDVLSFVSGAGSYAISVNPAGFSPNLDILAELYDGDGFLIASSNPIDSLPASLSGTLTAGEYYLHIDGVGKGSPTGTGYSDYASLGRYTISGTAPDGGSLVAPIAVAQITDPAYVPVYAGTSIGFDGTLSTDPDGDPSQLNWSWTFGNEAVGSGEYTSHAFATSGDHTVTLMVTDTDQLTHSDSLVVTILNTAPTAVISLDTTTGEAPVEINFDGSSSSDSDGTIVSYYWQFGDGSNSTQQSPSHTYTNSGTLTATLTVTDNLGDTHSDTQELEITPPPYLDYVARGQQSVAGTVSGSYLDTHTEDGSSQSIRERTSGGKKSKRYSYLEHIWVINVQPGDAMTLNVSGYQSTSSDDQMEISVQLPGQSNFQAPAIALGTSPSQFSYSLPASTSGEVLIRVTDSDRTEGNRSLDTVYIDHLYIRITNGIGWQQIVEPTWSTVAPSTNSIDLQWIDNSDNEDGFRVERSTDQLNWISVNGSSNFPADTTSYTDSGLTSSTAYYYRVRAFNADASSIWSTTSTTTESDGPSGVIVLSANGYKYQGRSQVDLSWTGSTSSIITRNGSPLGPNPVTGTSYTDVLGRQDNGTYSYQVCSSSTSSVVCSDEVLITF